MRTEKEIMHEVNRLLEELGSMQPGNPSREHLLTVLSTLEWVITNDDGVEP